MRCDLLVPRRPLEEVATDRVAAFVPTSARCCRSSVVTIPFRSDSSKATSTILNWLNWRPDRVTSPKTGRFVRAGAECLVGVDPDDAQEGRDLAVQSFADLGDFIDAEAGKRGAGLIQGKDSVAAGVTVDQ